MTTLNTLIWEVTPSLPALKYKLTCNCYSNNIKALNMLGLEVLKVLKVFFFTPNYSSRVILL